MKKLVLSIVILATISVAFKPLSGVVGKMFPNIECETYTGKKLILPTDTKGKYTLVGMAFSNDAEHDLKTWMGPIYNKFIGQDTTKADVFDVGVDYDVNLYFMPMFTGLNQVTSKQSKEKIKKATDKELHPYVVFYEGSLKVYKEALDFERKDIPYFFVLDKTGKIAYATSGQYDSKKLEKILDVIEEN